MLIEMKISIIEILIKIKPENALKLIFFKSDSSQI